MCKVFFSSVFRKANSHFVLPIMWKTSRVMKKGISGCVHTSRCLHFHSSHRGWSTLAPIRRRWISEEVKNRKKMSIAKIHLAHCFSNFDEYAFYRKFYCSHCRILNTFVFWSTINNGCLFLVLLLIDHHPKKLKNNTIKYCQIICSCWNLLTALVILRPGNT